MKLIYIFVNYNNSNESIESILSLASGSGFKDSSILIVDNCSRKDEISKLKSFISKYDQVLLIENKINEGYFSGLNIGINYININKLNFDFLIVGNNDLTFPNDFFEVLFSRSAFISGFPVVSPSIITIDGHHQNPHVINKIFRLREIAYDFIYYNYYFFRFAIFLSGIFRSLFERGDEKHFNIAQEIYQGYGACYILTKHFFNNWVQLPTNSFLFYEEYFLSYQLASKNFKVYYDPQIIVYHRMHKSTGIMPKRVMWKYAKIAHWEHRKTNKIF